MSKKQSLFVPSHLDFEMRAIALRDYQRLVLKLEVREDCPSKNGLLDKRHLLWLLSEIMNIAYLPFSGDHLELRNGKYEWASGKKLNRAYHECLRLANQIYDQVLENQEILDELRSQGNITRNYFLTIIDKIADEVLDKFSSRTKIPKLQNSFVHGTSAWALVIRDEVGYAPWVIPELCSSSDDLVKRHRVKILSLLHVALREDISNYEHGAQMTEFGTPKISLIKLANKVHALDHVARSSEKPLPDDYAVQPAEVGTVLDQIQRKLGISNRRHFLYELKDQLEIQRRESVEAEKIDEYYFKNK